MYQAKSGVKNFPLYWGGGSLCENFFFQSEHVSSQIWCQNFFPLLGGSPSAKFFFQSEHVSSQIWCQKFFPLLGGGVPLRKFFSSLNMYQAKSGVKNFSLYQRWGTTPPTHGWIGYPPLWTDTQTGVKTLPSRRTTYAGGNKLLLCIIFRLQSHRCTIMSNRRIVSSRGHKNREKQTIRYHH